MRSHVSGSGPASGVSCVCVQWEGCRRGVEVLWGVEGCVSSGMDVVRGVEGCREGCRGPVGCGVV